MAARRGMQEHRMYRALIGVLAECTKYPVTRLPRSLASSPLPTPAARHRPSSSVWALAAMAFRSLLAVLVLAPLLVSAVALHVQRSAGAAQASVGEGAAAAQASTQSWTDAAKDTLTAFAADAKLKVGETVDVAGKYAYDSMGAAKDFAYDSMGVAKDTTGAAQHSAESYLDMAKEKLNVFSKYVSTLS